MSNETDLYGNPVYNTARFPNVLIVVDCKQRENFVRTTILEDGNLKKEISVDAARFAVEYFNKKIEFYDSPYHQWCRKKTGKL